MDGIISRVMLGIIRHAVSSFFAGWTVKGYITGDQQQAAITAVMTLVPIAFSVYDKIQSAQKSGGQAPTNTGEK